MIDLKNITNENITIAIVRYINEVKKRQIDFEEYARKSKGTGKSVFDILCEIDNILTYHELADVFSQATGIPKATDVQGAVTDVDIGRHVATVDNEGVRRFYIWHPVAVQKLFKKSPPDDLQMLLVDRETFKKYSSNQYVRASAAGVGETLTDVTRETLVNLVKLSMKAAAGGVTGMAGATDIHIYPVIEQQVYKIALRLLGDLVDVETLSSSDGRQLANVVLNWAKEKTPSIQVDEKRKPVDGRIVIPGASLDWYSDIDLRVSMMWKSNMTDADIVLRILYKIDMRDNTLSQLGFLPKQVGLMEMALARTRGIILVTGATGSGKSRTMNTLLTLVSKGKNILTVEDPIEYILPNGRQFQTMEWESVNGEIVSVGFSDLARAFKRHDPDIILIGELRDKETVSTAFHLAKTGHLVLGTLHVARATAVPETLVEDYGVSVDAVADNLVLVANQVLVKRLCETCKVREVFTDPPDWLRKLRFINRETALARLRGQAVFHAPGGRHRCERCAQKAGTTTLSGYTGRTAGAEVFELLPGMFKDKDISVLAMEEKLSGEGNILSDMVDKILAGAIGVESLRSLL
jgi:general secretion pathway protein E